MPRARSLLGCVFGVWWIDRIRVRWFDAMCCDVGPMSFVGRPAFPFIGQGKAWVTVEGKGENEKENKSSRIAGSFISFTRVPPIL